MEKSIIKPKARRSGDTIGIAAPASPFDQKAFEGGIAMIKSMGYQVKIPKSIFKAQGYLAGSDAERAELLMNLFTDESVKAILCARGGFGSMKLLPRLDFEAIRANPKILMGFSDITALLVAIFDSCRMVTFHGPLVTTLKQDSGETCSTFIEAVSSGTPLVLTSRQPMVLSPGKASGILMGGNLTSLCHLLATPYEPDFNGRLLFLEDRQEAPYRIDRMLSQLHLSGHLDGVGGVILGSFEACGSLEDVYAIFKEAFRHTGVPILAGFELGHGTHNFTVPIGLEAKMNTEDGSLRFRGPAVHEGHR
jgi:muramoyltetrapeptide carboxypeptidase